MSKAAEVSIKRPAKGKLPSLSFQRLKDEILGREYELSIFFSKGRESRALNARFRGKDRPTNILSFALSKNSGELVIHLPTVKKEAARAGESLRGFLGHLIIHGMLHLKGMRHGSKMEDKEKKHAKRFRFLQVR